MLGARTNKSKGAAQRGNARTIRLYPTRARVVCMNRSPFPCTNPDGMAKSQYPGPVTRADKSRRLRKMRRVNDLQIAPSGGKRLSLKQEKKRRKGEKKKGGGGGVGQ